MSVDCCLEGGYGEEVAESVCGKDQDRDRWYKPCPATELREVLMCRQPHRRRQQQYLMLPMQHWVHKKCSKLEHVKEDLNYKI